VLIELNDDAFPDAPRAYERLPAPPPPIVTVYVVPKDALNAVAFDNKPPAPPPPPEALTPLSLSPPPPPPATIKYSRVKGIVQDIEPDCVNM
jgi:hypothetical protein